MLNNNDYFHPNEGIQCVGYSQINSSMQSPMPGALLNPSQQSAHHEQQQQYDHFYQHQGHQNQQLMSQNSQLTRSKSLNDIINNFQKQQGYTPSGWLMAESGHKSCSPSSNDNDNPSSNCENSIFIANQQINSFAQQSNFFAPATNNDGYNSHESKRSNSATNYYENNICNDSFRNICGDLRISHHLYGLGNSSNLNNNPLQGPTLTDTLCKQDQQQHMNANSNGVLNICNQLSSPNHLTGITEQIGKLQL